MSRFILTILVVFQFLGISAQDKKEFKHKFLEAEHFFLIEEYDEAAFLYYELLNSDPDNANLLFLRGASLLSAGKPYESIDYLERAVASISPGYREGSYRERNAPKQALFALAKAYHINEDLERALEYYEKYKNVMQLRDVAEVEFVNKQMKSVKLATNMIQDTLLLSHQSVPLREVHFGNSYNAVYSEGDSTLFFMSDKTYYTAVMSSRFSNGKWTEPRILNEELKIDGNIRLSSVSYDGKILILSIDQNFNKDLYWSSKNGNGWNPVEPIEEINTEFNESHASLNKENNLMFFVSDRPEGSGSRDIYTAEKLKDGSWGNIKNMGKPVNSLYSEETPFITSDGKTLYFSSMGHSTIGGFDIFFTKKMPSGSWSYPANIGFPVSTTHDDLSYFPLANGEQALITNPKFNPHQKEIQIIDHQSKELLTSINITGKVITEDNAFFTEDTEIKIVNKITRDTIASLKPNPETGEYAVAEVPEGEYEINITASGYDTVVEQLALGEANRMKELQVESSLKPKEVSEGKYIVAKNVLFDFDSYDLSEEARFEMEKLYKVMADNPELNIELTGHTDSKGSREYNLNLSNRRTQAVIDYLVSKGITKERFISKAVGEEKNIAINRNPDGTDNPEGRRFNRQVEIKIINEGKAKDIWLEEYMIPDRLKSEAYKKFYVVLDEVLADSLRINSDNMQDKVKLFETGRKNIYAAGEFSSRIEAMKYLNEQVDTDFPDGRIVSEEDFQYLLEPVYHDESRVKGPFTVQLLAVRNQVSLNYFKGLGEVTQIQSADGIYRYIYGVYDNFTEASDKLSDFVLKGYSDCFILPVSRIITGDKNSAVDTGNLDYYYTIQFSATLKELDPSRFKNFENVVKSHGKDGFFRYSVGIYLNKREAEIMLERVREEGFADAFLKKISRPH
jgi:outer membrane protein OmpA-like peptidoglycan-associated protein/tetratricopeptide (TPR) repeat protein